MTIDDVKRAVEKEMKQLNYCRFSATCVPAYQHRLPLGDASMNKMKQSQ
jgi:hypothetical protein